MTMLGTLLREGGLALLLLLLITLAVKIAFQIEFNARNPLARHPVADESLYIRMAEEIAEGRFSTGEVFHMAPLYPYLMAPVLKVCGSDPFGARIFQALVGTLSILVFYMTARLYFSKSWALVAAASMVLYYPITFFEAKLLIATSALFFTALSLLFLAGQRAKTRLWTSGAAGIAAGLAAAVRPNLILFCPLAGLWLFWAFRGRKGLVRALLFLIGAALPILPFTVHNYLAEEDFVLLSDNGGINFYLGNNAASRGSFHIGNQMWADIEYQYPMAKLVAEGETGRTLKPSAVSRFWFAKGLEFPREKPLEYLVLLAKKLKSFLENFEYAIIYTPPAERDLSLSLFFLFLPFAAILSAAGVGFCAWLRDRGGKPSRNASSGEGAWGPVLILLIINMISVLLFFNYSRFRLTAVPAMILLGVYGLRAVRDLLAQKRKGALAAHLATAGLLLAVSLVPWGDQWRLQKAHGLATVASAFRDGQETASAEAYYTKALETAPELDIIRSRRAMVRIQLKDFEGAKEDLDRAVRINPDFPLHLITMATLYASDAPFRDLDRALHFVQSAAEKPMLTPHDRAQVYSTEGAVRMERQEYGWAARAFESAFALTPENVEALFLSGLAHRLNGEMEKAKRAFLEVLQLDPDHAGARQELQ
jgi:4-amino-4-deoxy-L-arabinose transferase-like glycosyltransferase/Tfp pilus assembly protein PilF